MYKKSAFTLAEVLITLGIIGVVAAMTITTLLAKYQEKQTVTKLKQTYSILSQAIRSVQVLELLMIGNYQGGIIARMILF